MTVMDGGTPPAPENPTPEEQQPVDLAGRKDVPDLVQAYRASGQEALRQKQRADQLEQQLAQSQYVANPRQEIPQRNRPEDRLTELGIPVDALEEMIGSRLQSAFQPIAQGFQARNEMLANYGPDYGKFESDVAQYVQSDPGLSARYQRMFQTDPVGAMEFAFLKFGETQRRAQPQANGASASREQQAQAAVPTSSGGSESRRPAAGGQERVNRAWEAYQKNPNKFTAEQYAKARFKSAISDEFLAGR